MYKRNVIEAVAGRTNIRAEEVELVINATLFIIMNAVADGESVSLEGFGGFVPVRGRGSWEVKLASGDRIQIPDPLVPEFRTSQTFVDKVAIRNSPKKIHM